MSPTILYLDTIPGDPIQALTLAGIWRYAAAWAPGADQYLRDCISLFEEYGGTGPTTPSASRPSGMSKRNAAQTENTFLLLTIPASAPCSTASA